MAAILREPRGRWNREKGASDCTVEVARCNVSRGVSRVSDARATRGGRKLVALAELDALRMGSTVGACGIWRLRLDARQAKCAPRNFGTTAPA